MTESNGKYGSSAETQRRMERAEKNIDELYTKYEGIGRTNWTIVLSAVGVVITGGTIVIAAVVGPINATLTRHENQFGYYVTHDSSKEYRKRIDDALSEMKRDMTDLSNRGDARFNELRRDLGGAYSFSDKIKDMEREMDALRERLWRTFVPTQTQKQNGSKAHD